MSFQRKRKNPSAVNHRVAQVQELQDKANFSNDAKQFNDPESASSSGLSRVPSQPTSIPSPRGMICRDSGLPHCTRYSTNTSGNVSESLPALGRISPSLPSNSKKIYQSIGYYFERLGRGVLELMSRFDFDFCRCGK